MGSSGIAKMGDCLGWRTSLDSFCGILRQIVCETGAILTFTDSCLGLPAWMRSVPEDCKQRSEKTVERCAIWPGHIQSVDSRF
jgi:hypothetical protein